MYELNEKIRDLTPYDPITGTYPIRLDANESFLSLPEELRARIGEAAARAALYADANVDALFDVAGTDFADVATGAVYVFTTTGAESFAIASNPLFNIFVATFARISLLSAPSTTAIK